jgi:L-alanine-DL-glutamate epimerase-like enolase superfamily enzyme
VADSAGPLIAAVETTTVSARAKPALKVRGARVVHDASTFVLVRVVTGEGVEGFGEVSATAAWSGEDAVTATHFIRDVLGPRLVGRALAPIASHATEFDRVLRGNWFTKAGVSTALWDALGRVRGESVASLLGGPFRTEVPVKISLSGDGDDLRAGYETAVGLGFRSFKVKVGRDPAEDAARVRLARELAGDDALIGADANGGWPLPVALETVPELAESGIAFIEQPVRADDLDGLREVRALGVPLIADESVYSPADVLQVGRAGAADIVSVYVGKSSGLERAVESARLAGELGMDVVIGANGEMGIGAAAQLHVACACERISSIPHGIIGHHFYEDDASLAARLEIDGLVARLPVGPGLGVEPSDEVRRSFSS